MRTVPSPRGYLPAHRRAARAPKAAKPTWRKAAEDALRFWPLAAPISFAVTNLLLAFVFSRWGLLHAQLVGTGDLFAVGFVASVFALLAPSMAYVPGAAIDTAIEALPLERRPTVLVIALSLAFLVTGAGWWIGGRIGQNVAIIAFWLGLGFAWHALARIKTYQHKRRWRALIVLPSLVVLLGTTGAGVRLSYELFAARGFVSGLEIDQGAKSPCAGTVMWLGDKTTVVQCRSVDGKPPTYAVLAKDGLVLYRRPAAQDDHAKARP